MKEILLALIYLSGIAVCVIYEIITWPLKKLKLMKWDYMDYVVYMNMNEYSDIKYLNWQQESFYKIKIDYGIINGFGMILELFPMFSNKVYLTVDDNPVDTTFSKPIITPGTIKTTIWNWHIHKEELIHKLKLKKNEIRKQEIEGDFK